MNQAWNENQLDQWIKSCQCKLNTDPKNELYKLNYDNAKIFKRSKYKSNKAMWFRTTTGIYKIVCTGAPLINYRYAWDNSSNYQSKYGAQLYSQLYSSPLSPFGYLGSYDCVESAMETILLLMHQRTDTVDLVKQYEISAAELSKHIQMMHMQKQLATEGQTVKKFIDDFISNPYNEDKKNALKMKLSEFLDILKNY